MDLVGRSFVFGIVLVVGDDPHGRRIAVRDVLEPLGHQAALSEQISLRRAGRLRSLVG